ncbi:MAG: peptide-methionine (R)-S-oxide reductase [Bacteroidetes bacterium MedPE-SWsnd-G2]|nr:MAG: peptide-methionine (R)-S-oxide reductase [Bacteroidetes bacterium MedPE-SWsnd-G2]
MKITTLILGLLLVACNSNAQQDKLNMKPFKVSKTEAEWKVLLTPAQFHVLREAGTERPNSSAFNSNKSKGTYVCAACETPLFKSEHKYDSGSGWPSFDREIKGNVAFSTDYNLGYGRTEEHCATCGGHLGHVFDDGPRRTTGKRHCVNGVALKFVPNSK